MSTRQGTHVGAQFHRDDLIAALGERDGRLAGTTPYLEDARLGPTSRQIGQVVKELRRVCRPHPVVQISRVVERSASG